MFPHDTEEQPADFAIVGAVALEHIDIEHAVGLYGDRRRGVIAPPQVVDGGEVSYVVAELVIAVDGVELRTGADRADKQRMPEQMLLRFPAVKVFVGRELRIAEQDD